VGATADDIFSTPKKYEVETKTWSYFFALSVNLPPQPRASASAVPRPNPASFDPPLPSFPSASRPRSSGSTPSPQPPPLRPHPLLRRLPLSSPPLAKPHLLPTSTACTASSFPCYATTQCVQLVARDPYSWKPLLFAPLTEIIRFVSRTWRSLPRRPGDFPEEGPRYVSSAGLENTLGFWFTDSCFQIQ
jgi:hypothetical protein